VARALWLADAIRAEGVTVVEEPGWKTAGSSSITPKVVVCHHTASGAGDAPALGIVKTGRSDVPGPLCNVLLSRSGVAHIVASGRSNNAGLGGWKGITGNSNTLGIEAENNGIGEPWPAIQMESYVRICAAMARHERIPVTNVIGHKEWTNRKIDPTFNMTDFRTRVALRLAGVGQELFTVAQYDEIMKQFAALNRRLDTFEKDRWKPTTKRVRELHTAAGLTDEDG
jgi:hypothetical protein